MFAMGSLNDGSRRSRTRVENRHSRGTGAKLANDKLRPRKDQEERRRWRRRRHTGGGGADSGQEGASDGNGGREREPGSLVVASVAGIARYTALSQISYQSRFCLVSSSASFPFFREESSRTRIWIIASIVNPSISWILYWLNSGLRRSHGKHGILRSRRQ